MNLAKLIGGPMAGRLYTRPHAGKLLQFPVMRQLTLNAETAPTMPAIERDEYLHIGPAANGQYEVFMYVGRKKP